MIIPKLFIEEKKEDGLTTVMRPATTQDIDKLVDEHYEVAIALGMLRCMGE